MGTERPARARGPRPVHCHRVLVDRLVFEVSTLQADPDVIDAMVERFLDHLPEWSAHQITIAYNVTPDLERVRGSLR